jgi:hypothetical protein
MVLLRAWWGALVGAFLALAVFGIRFWLAASDKQRFWIREELSSLFVLFTVLGAGLGLAWHQRCTAKTIKPQDQDSSAADQ